LQLGQVSIIIFRFRNWLTYKEPY